uniref:radial spoke head 14 homolog isoform X1 n=1 Tax=Doryrhamphus excisus TaxID=161450 RepID=UPI0025AECA2D|nr:radial spoke head 14 homolog isoform X1 [Doryrhamphus excisus]
MTGVHLDPTRAPVAFGRLAIPELFAQLEEADTDTKLRALLSLCDVTHDPERLYQVVSEGFLGQLEVLMKDDEPAVRTGTCELLHLLTSHNIGRHALLSSTPLLSRLSLLLDDASAPCRTRAHRVVNSLALLPAGADTLQPLLAKLMVKLEEEEEEEEVQALLLSTLNCCSRQDALAALAHRGVTLIARKLPHACSDIRREAAGAMMALSVPVEGKRQVCEAAVLPVLAALLRDQDVDVQANAAGAIMNTVVITTGKHVAGLRVPAFAANRVVPQASISVWTWTSSPSCWTWSLSAGRTRRRRRGGRPWCSTPSELSPRWPRLPKAAAACWSSSPSWWGGARPPRTTLTSPKLLAPPSVSSPGRPENKNHDVMPGARTFTAANASSSPS